MFPEMNPSAEAMANFGDSLQLGTTHFMEPPHCAKLKQAKHVGSHEGCCCSHAGIVVLYFVKGVKDYAFPH